MYRQCVIYEQQKARNLRSVSVHTCRYIVSFGSPFKCVFADTIQSFQSASATARAHHRIGQFTKPPPISYNGSFWNSHRTQRHQCSRLKFSSFGRRKKKVEPGYSLQDVHERDIKCEEVDEEDVAHNHGMIYPITPVTVELFEGAQREDTYDSSVSNTGASVAGESEKSSKKATLRADSGSVSSSLGYEGQYNSFQISPNGQRSSSSVKSSTQDITRNAVQKEVTATIPSSRPKVDLSYFNVRKRESEMVLNPRRATPHAQPSTFRKNAGLRQIVAYYMRHVEPLDIQFSHQKTARDELDHKLLTNFSEHVLKILRQQGYDAEDVVSWSWILSASSSGLSIRRFVVYSQHLRANNCRPLPLFISLQLLRVKHMTATTLNLLIEEIETDLQIENRWQRESGSVLLIRLLRHARMVDVSQFERISDLTVHILPFEGREDAHKDAQRLTHFYNRFLSLLALPVARHPYLSTSIQQRAQLKIVRCMLGSKLSVVLNREGYRALARIQLMHKKTVDEQKWSSVKAPSWPPWRRDEIGIDAKIEYPGRHSRTSKVLRRLLEAGYGPASTEQEVQILSGWDSDKSPTIQARRITKRQPFSWLKNVFTNDKPQTRVIDHNVWAARVTATRSIREAWACFYSYMEATTDHKRALRVYHEMFSKIFARLQHSDQTSLPSPGDGKEVFADPTSTRDHIYVPREPPSVDELYTQMLQDGIRPAGRLLAALVDTARTLKQALDYIAESSLGDVKKDVLLHPEKYSDYAIRNLYAAIPDYLVASYLGVLAKRFPYGEVDLYPPGSKSAEERGSQTVAPVHPLRYSLTLLQTLETRYLPAYHAVLEGICTQSKARRRTDRDALSRKHSTLELWEMAKHILYLLEARDLCPDLICFRKLVIIFRNIMIRAPSQFGNHDADFANACKMLRSTFVKSINGSNKCGQSLTSGKELKIGAQPYWKDVEHVILISGMIRNFPAITEILRWMSEFEDDLDFVSEGGYKMQRLMCAARVGLEQSWNQDKSRGASSQQIEQTVRYAEKWGWPDDDVDVNEFLQLHEPWIESIRAATKPPLD